MTAPGSRRQQRKNVPSVSKRTAKVLATAAGFVLLLGGVVAGYRYLTQPGRLPLRVVDVSGEFQHLRREQIQQTVIKVIDGGFFSCDMQKLRAAVLELAWVEDVSIRRVWPDKLSMIVTEQVPLARWGEDALINVAGGVFRPPVLDDYSGLVKLHGPEGSEQRVVGFYQAAVPAARARALQISEIELDMRRHWWMRFDNGLTVSLGREDTYHRLAQFFRVYPSLASDMAHQPERVDMRYAHGFAVRWRVPAGGQPLTEDMKSQEKV